MSKRYALVFFEEGNYTVTMMTRVLGVSRSGYYDWRSRPRGKDPWADLRNHVEELWLLSGKRLGARGVLDKLVGCDSARPTLYRVRKCMHELGIRGIHPNTSKRTTIPDPNAATRPDLIMRRFDCPVPTIKLVGDITYLRTGEGWMYLATVIDLCTRMVVGWAIDDNMRAPLVVSALEMAKGRGYVAEGAIFHSDHGSQYTSALLAEWADANDVRLSVGRTGCCRDNAVAESFFASLKNEMYYLESFATRAKAKTAVIEYIESYYNRFRPHSTIGGKTPAQKMESFFERTDPDKADDVEIVARLVA